MKNRALLIGVLFLIFPKVGWGDEGSSANNFSNYVNSPESPSDTPSDTPVDKNINPGPATNDEHGKKPDETDAKPVLSGIPFKWKACAVDSDCTAGVVDCVSWVPLNKKYLHKLSKNLRSCSASVDPGFQPEAVCVAKVCQTTEKSTNVSWEEWLSKIK